MNFQTFDSLIDWRVLVRSKGVTMRAIFSNPAG